MHHMVWVISIIPILFNIFALCEAFFLKLWADVNLLSLSFFFLSYIQILLINVLCKKFCHPPLLGLAWCYNKMTLFKFTFVQTKKPLHISQQKFFIIPMDITLLEYLTKERPHWYLATSSSIASCRPGGWVVRLSASVVWTTERSWTYFR